MLNLKNTDSLLEIGCGAGMILGPLSERVNEAYGIDRSPSLIRKLKVLHPSIHAYVASGHDEIFEDGVFDKVLCFGVFHYFSDEDYATRVVENMLRVCKQGGTVVIGEVPDSELRAESIRFFSMVDKSCDRSMHRYYERSFFDTIARNNVPLNL